MAFDFKALNKNDQAALATGAVAVLLTFFPWYGTIKVKVKGGDSLGSLGGGSDSINSWHELATLGTLLLIAAFVIVVLRVVVGNVLPAGAPWNLITAGLAGLATLILVIYVFTFGPDVPSIAKDSIEVSSGPGWSGWLLLIAAIAFTVFSFLGFRASGEKIPEMNKRDGNTPPAPPAPPAA